MYSFWLWKFAILCFCLSGLCWPFDVSMSGFCFNAINLSPLCLPTRHSALGTLLSQYYAYASGPQCYPGGWLFLRLALIFMFVCRCSFPPFLFGFLLYLYYMCLVYVFPRFFLHFFLLFSLMYLMAFLARFILLACVRDPTPSDKHAAATVAGFPAGWNPIPAPPVQPFSYHSPPLICVSGMRLSFQLMAFNGIPFLHFCFSVFL